jgi:predicted nucleic acid-binding OB-fold protein
MKSFIDRIFKKRKHDVEQIEESIRTEDKATEAVVEAIIEEVKKELKKEEVFAKPGHYFPDCNCFKCVRWKNQQEKSL